MKTSRHRFLLILVALLVMVGLAAPSVAHSQSTIENAIQAYGKQNIQGYMQPIADLFGANMNSGYYHSAAISFIGFHLSLDFVGMAAPVSDDQKTYTASTPQGFLPATFQTPTIFGDKGPTITSVTPAGYTYRGSDGVLNAKMFPLAAPQLTLGSLLGTEAVVRFIAVPQIGDNKFPKTTLLGVGGRHSISQYIPLLPLDIAVGVFYSTLKSGDFIDFKGLCYGAQASKTLSVLTVHGGVNVESSTLKLSYTSTDPVAPGSIEVNLDGKRKFSMTAGLEIALGVFHLFGNANFGSINNFTAGFGFGN
jgi:hypothetical protein